ncbi:hypothetical protein NNO_2060 [Hydrogenimonas sp.]|nr:hypothetical protein NNO_2060 [Hydrogenimonas sp.]
MYHYLKWAALSLFFKRNMRYLLLILVSIAGIYISDALYEDMVRLSVISGETGKIGGYLLMKWAAVLFFAALIVWSIMRLGLGAKRSTDKKESEKTVQDDPYLKRLEKFKTKKRLRSESDMVLEAYRKEKKGEQ